MGIIGLGTNEMGRLSRGCKGVVPKSVPTSRPVRRGNLSAALRIGYVSLSLSLSFRSRHSEGGGSSQTRIDRPVGSDIP